MVERFGYKVGDYPVTEDLGARGIALPFSGVMTEDQVKAILGEPTSVRGREWTYRVGRTGIKVFFESKRLKKTSGFET